MHPQLASSIFCSHTERSAAVVEVGDAIVVEVAVVLLQAAAVRARAASPTPISP
jgi:hypothetical protein